jgi:RNA polymerase sigma-70 factor (ECF subfamily)
VVVAINRAVALAAHLDGTRGAVIGLAALDTLKEDVQLAEYQPYWAARAALLARTGATQAAAEAYRRAIGLESDPAVRRFLQAKLSRV